MDNRVRLAMEANRKFVQDGLNRRRLDGELDAFEDAMIRRCNEKHYEACLQSQADEAISRNRELSKNRIAERAEKAERREKAKQTRKDIALACLIFFIFASVMVQLTICTILPVWASIACIDIVIPFLVSFICDPSGFPTV